MSTRPASATLIDIMFHEELGSLLEEHIEENLDEILKTAWRNRVTYRFLSKVTVSSTSLRERLASLLDAENLRQKRILALVDRVNNLLVEGGVEHVLMKTMDNYPDFGHDIDYLVDGDFDTARRLIESKLGGKRVKRLSVADRIVGKKAFTIPEPLGCGAGVEVEIYPRVSQVGEKNLFTEIILERAKNIEIGGIRARVPSKEDQLLITCVHAFYRSLGIRLSEIYNSINLIKGGGLDWDYAFDHAVTGNISRGFSFFIRLLDDFHQRYLGCELIPTGVLRRSERLFGGQVQIPSNYPNEFGFNYFITTYLNKGLSDAYDLRLRSAGSALIVAPTLGVLASMLYRTTGKTNLIW
ncbi:MAG: nucleotidyltransferase family protein [Thaumarchaeota archaeon]|nr:nucleotidyltransferase family protein [Nitrososphaerota archaeon]